MKKKNGIHLTATKCYKGPHFDVLEKANFTVEKFVQLWGWSPWDQCLLRVVTLPSELSSRLAEVRLRPN